jgi:hypothetical protein
LEKDFEDFEQSLTDTYFEYFGRLLIFKFHFTDWLAERLRIKQYKRKDKIRYYISTDYIKAETHLSNFKTFLVLLQLLKFTRNLKYEMMKFDSIDYRVVKFRVDDFAKICDFLFKSENNHYKVHQTKRILAGLQQTIFLEIFDDPKFVKLLDFAKVGSDRNQDYIVGFPRLTFSECPITKYSLVRIVMVNDLFLYIYPFKLPDFFQVNDPNQKLSKYQYLVRAEVIKIYSCRSTEKIFNLREFFNNHKVSNKKIKEMKTDFIKIVQMLSQSNLIEPKIKLMVLIN